MLYLVGRCNSLHSGRDIEYTGKLDPRLWEFYLLEIQRYEVYRLFGEPRGLRTSLSEGGSNVDSKV